MMRPHEFVPPMLATTADREMKDDEDWRYEIKWDGYRAMISFTDRLRVFSRRGHDFLAKFPGLLSLEADLSAPAVIDCELVAWDQGRPSFEKLQQGPGDDYTVMVFDILWTATGGWQLHKTLDERLDTLQSQFSTKGRLVIPDSIVGRGESLFRAAEEQGLEGVIAKSRNSRYIPGKRVSTWQKYLFYKTEWFWVPVIHKTASGVWQWTIAEKGGGNWSPVGRLTAPRNWNDPDDRFSDRLLPQPIAVEVSFRERMRGGQLRHAVIRRFGDQPLD